MTRILIVGAGIAGQIVALQLARAGIPNLRTVLVERAASIRTAGQTLDINGFARKLIDRLGVEGDIRKACTGEEGTLVVDDADEVVARLPVGLGPTNEYEIVRHRLCKVFYDNAKDTTEYRFGDSVRSISQTDKEATVEFESGRQESFDAVVIADGLGSRTRSLVFEQEAVKMEQLGVAVAYFAVPPQPSDAPWSRLWFGPGRRAIWLRPAPLAVPEPPKTLACLLIVLDESNQHLFAAHRSLGVEGRKRIWEKLYRGAGWQTDRVLDQMDLADDFHSQEMAQVKIDSWYRGRVVVTGDASCCPSPLSGMGTSHAIVSAYVLGQELARAAADPTSLSQLHDVTSSFQSYDSIVRPYAEQRQVEIPPAFARRFIFPESRIGVSVLQGISRGVGWVTSWKKAQKWAQQKQKQDADEEGLDFEEEGSDIVVRSKQS